MLLEGVKLMMMGMVTVVIFLVVMIYCIQIVAFLSRHITAAELQQMEAAKQRKAAISPGEEEVPIAVFAAAIAAYEADRARVGGG